MGRSDQWSAGAWTRHVHGPIIGPIMWLFALAAMASPNAVLAADLTVDAGSGFIIPVEMNGHLVRLRVDPEAPGYVVVNPNVARRIGLRPSLLTGYALIGPVRLHADTKVATIVHAGTRFDRRVAWVTRDAVQDAEGLINPAGLPYDRVIFTFGAPRSNETRTVLNVEYKREVGLVFPARVGGQRTLFQFSTNKPHSLATAAAGAQIAAAYGGSWSGDPFEQVIEFSVSRPVRRMLLARPMSLLGFAAGAFLVRTGDHRGDKTLPSEPLSDPEEIIVTAATKSGQEAMFMLTFGRDRLSACSSMIYEALPRRRLVLVCSPGLPPR